MSILHYCITVCCHCATTQVQSTHMEDPWKNQAEKQIVKTFLDKEPVTFFEHTKKSHTNTVFIFSDDTKKYVLRTNKDPNVLKGFSYHYHALEKMNIPMSEILHEDYSLVIFPFAYHIVAFIEGHELHDVVDTLSTEQMKEITKDLATFQESVAHIHTPGRIEGFGRTSFLGEDLKSPTWFEFMMDTLSRRMLRMQTSGNFDLMGQVEWLEKEMLSQRDLFDGQHYAFFLDDITDKNFIIVDGKVSALIDLDYLMYGDPMHLLGKLQSLWPHENTKGNEYFKIAAKAFGYDIEKHQRIILLYAIIEALGPVSFDAKLYKDALDTFLLLIDRYSKL